MSDQLLRPVDQSMKVGSQLGQEPRMPDQLFQPDDQILGDMKPVKRRKAYDSAYEAFSKHASLEPGQAPTEELRPLFSFLLCNTSCQCRTSTPALKAHFGWSMESIVKFIDALDDGCNLLLQLRPKPTSKKL